MLILKKTESNEHAIYLSFFRCNLEKTEMLKNNILNMIPGLRVNHLLRR